MSKILMPEELLNHIKNLLIAIPKAIETYHKLPKTSSEPVKPLLTKFITNPLIKGLIEAPPSGKTSQDNPWII